MRSARLPCIVLEDGLFPTPIHIEAVIRPGLPVFRISGTGRASSRDREDRIKTALLASGVAFPYCTVLVHLSPAEIPKPSALLDLPIALCLLLALGEMDPAPWEGTLLLGELSLTGQILDRPEALAWTLAASEGEFRNALLPRETARALPHCRLRVFWAENLRSLIAGERQAQAPAILPYLPLPRLTGTLLFPVQLARALALAAAGRHPLLLVGPPGSGKSTAAETLHSLLPMPSREEWAEMIRHRLLFQEPATPGRPLRRPHHSITVAGLVGGGIPLRPGEANRATHGLLLLDELAEFEPAVIQALREPLERQTVLHNRAGRPGILPARFWFVATSNPCSCGFYGSQLRDCSCSRASVDRSRSILAGPLRDRIDMELFLQPDSPKTAHQPDLFHADPARWCNTIARCVQIQSERYGGRRYNGELNADEVEKFCTFEDEETRRLWQERTRMSGSKRQEGGVRRLARTIADMDEASCIRAKDILEALTFRFQQTFWEQPLANSVTRERRIVRKRPA